MTKEEQVEFVNSLLGSVQREFMGHIEKGGIPNHWDGHELREWLREKFSAACFIPMSRKRKREYNNTVMVNNL